MSFIPDNQTGGETRVVVEKKLKGDGRVIIRPSGTEPVMRVMVEGSDKKLINIVAKELEQVILGVV